MQIEKEIPGQYIVTGKNLLGGLLGLVIDNNRPDFVSGPVVELEDRIRLHYLQVRRRESGHAYDGIISGWTQSVSVEGTRKRLLYVLDIDNNNIGGLKGNESDDAHVQATAETWLKYAQEQEGDN